ncbi:NAD(P)-dependent oxidoreductase [Sphingomonas jatrophae]|uniref:Phosphoglycerate dehydrogenase n=1 Tax=Sphingomonas jatrophae TaxID=1166337 RepID=A0A1I6M3T7_9SPHN|nr:NAD(P)-dependent oxidoreductase [Sphingomonas jatrophae]SFS10341.1 Phosphoglycerate dehydrogenase [Sphingomonas jatrophae]
MRPTDDSGSTMPGEAASRNAGTPLRMLFPRDGWVRMRDAIADAGIRIEPVLFEPDGSFSVEGRAIPLDQARFTAAWFSLDTFARGQDEAFLARMVEAPDLRWMQSARAGYDHPAFARLAAKGVRLSMSKAMIPAIGEYVVAAVFDHFQRGPERRAAQAAQRWQAFPFREIAGSRWLCVGYGEIGRDIAVRARALGAHVTGVRRSGGTDADADAIVRPDDMADALAQADVVILSVPLTRDNDGAYGADFFAGFKPGALFINVGRGPLLDEAALRSALDDGRVGHAVLDVCRVEPLPPGEWQWTHPRVTLTAHTAGIGSGLYARTDRLLVDNLVRYTTGAPLLHEIGPEALA